MHCLVASSLQRWEGPWVSSQTLHGEETDLPTLPGLTFFSDLHLPWRSGLDQVPEFSSTACLWVEGAHSLFTASSHLCSFPPHGLMGHLTARPPALLGYPPPGAFTSPLCGPLASLLPTGMCLPSEPCWCKPRSKHTAVFSDSQVKRLQDRAQLNGQSCRTWQPLDFSGLGITTHLLPGSNWRA